MCFHIWANFYDLSIFNWSRRCGSCLIANCRGCRNYHFLLQTGVNFEDINEIIRCVHEIFECDIVLIEGANDPYIPKIRLGENIPERENTIMFYDGNFGTIIQLIKDEIYKKKVDIEERIIIRVNGERDF